MQDRMSPGSGAEPSRPPAMAGGTERRASTTAIAYATRPGDHRPLQEACRRLGLELLDVLREPQPPGDRPALAQALNVVADGRAECLVVRRLTDLDGGPGGLEAVLGRVDAGRLRLIAVDVGLDTATTTGRLALRSRDRDEPPAAAPAVTRCIGYACATDPAEGDGGADLAPHRQAIERWCADANVELVELVGDRARRHDKPLERPGLGHAVGRLVSGDASCLVVARLDHLSQSAAELGQVLARLQEIGGRLVAIDLAVDTGTVGGAAVARALATIGGWERQRLSDRTRAGLQAADARRRAGTSEDARATALRQRIAAMREQGMTLQAIADVLNAEGVPTQRGGRKWRPSSVQTAAGYRRPSARRAGG